ncbi:MAG: polymer-forming cytoskeletal protein [Nitrospiraceae bacterium]|nr:polymer-forming cytoskeletal protein [Nitrospiraceae bacterium]
MSENPKTIGNPDNHSEKTVSILKLPERAAYEGGMAEPGMGALAAPGNAGTMNAIINGSKLTGNMIITRDLEITGDYEGDITSDENSNIFIKGTCKGNIRTKGGSVEIEGSMHGGDIIAGGHVKVTGKFHGGKIQATVKIHINGEFSGILESADIEVGASAQGKGELVYRESLSIEKGAKVEGRIIRLDGGSAPEPKPKKGLFSKKTEPQKT